jgi:hypothetical protein
MPDREHLGQPEPGVGLDSESPGDRHPLP